MKLISTFLGLALVIGGCSSTTKTASQKLEQQNNMVIDYTEESRGFYNHTQVKNHVIYVQKERNSKPIAITCSDKEWEAIQEKVNALNLNELKNFEAPSESRFHDGAPIGKFKITVDGKEYATPEFDAGNPNKNIAPLVNQVLTLSQKVE